MPWLYLLLAIPLVEIFLFATLGAAIGPWMTLGLVLLTAFIGINLLRYQGLATAKRAQERIRMGELPETELLEGLMLAIGGFFLIVPGFFSDFIGFCLLMPLSRRWLRDRIVTSQLKKRKHADKGQYWREAEAKDATPDSVLYQRIYRSGTFEESRRTEASEQTRSKHRHTIEGEFRQD
jgi:UPF0716 protein FxsA